MNLSLLIAEIAGRADDFLEGVNDRAQARAGIAELLTAEYVPLSQAARREVIHGVMATLESEDFFGIEFVGDAFRDDEVDPHE